MRRGSGWVARRWCSGPERAGRLALKVFHLHLHRLAQGESQGWKREHQHVAPDQLGVVVQCLRVHIRAGVVYGRPRPIGGQAGRVLVVVPALVHLMQFVQDAVQQRSTSRDQVRG